MDKLDFLNNVFLENEIKDYLVFILVLLFGYILISPISSYLDGMETIDYLNRILRKI